MDPVARSTKRQMLNLLDLPFEIRSRIFTLAIEPNSDDASDTKASYKTEGRLKQVCRQTYCDISNIPRNNFTVLKVDQTDRDLLRATKDFPHPQLLSGQHRQTRCHQAPAFTALNILRLTNLAIEVKWIGWSIKDEGTMLRKKLNSLTWILKDSASIKRVCLIVQSDSCYSYASTDLEMDDFMRTVLLKLVDAVATTGIKIRAEHDRWRDNHQVGDWVEETGPIFYPQYKVDPVVEYLNEKAGLRNCLDPDEKTLAPGPPSPLVGYRE